MAKNTTAQREKIRGLVLELYLFRIRGLSDIQKVVQDKTKIEISERQIARYVAEVKEELRTSAKFDRDEEIGKAIARYEEIFRRAMAAKRYSAAVMAQRGIDELLGIKAPEEYHHSGVDLHSWMIEQAEKREAAGNDKDKNQPNGGSLPH